MSRTIHDDIASYVPYDKNEALSVEQLRYFLKDSQNPFSRDNIVAHLVADAWIVNPERTKVLMLFHAYKGFWMTAGGHCEGTPYVCDDAFREVFEEMGLDLRDGSLPTLFDVNTGYLLTREKEGRIEPEHLHFDICYLMEADERAPLLPNEESTEIKWIPIEELPTLKIMDCHQRRVTKTLDMLNKKATYVD